MSKRLIELNMKKKALLKMLVRLEDEIVEVSGIKNTQEEVARC
ncbi:hypothetical protein [Lederbergia lenta]|nr:hypothetical protein [Lederbergia lenta]